MTNVWNYFSVWLDRAEGINSNINKDMAKAVENAQIITKEYLIISQKLINQ